MPHHNGHCYEFGPYRLNPSERLLTRDGETIALTPKATDILVLLVSNAGQLLQKDELLNKVWPNTFVEEANLAQNVFVLRRALGDERADPKYIETVTRRGYRFIAEVKAVEAGMHSETEIPAFAPADFNGRTIVAVLPFLNETRDEELEYLADGLTNNIINNLSRVSKLRVLSRSAVFRHKKKELDPQVIGKELSASAVLVGKLNSRPAGITISVELIEAATGWLLWGDSFDCPSKDILEIQDAITRQLLASLKLQLSGEEEKHVTARYTENAEAYQSYLEGRYHWSRYTRKGIVKAIGHFRCAIELDPNYALAYAGIVDCYLRLATNYLPPEDDVPQPDGEPAYQPQASESDPRVKLRFEWDWKGAERELRRANELKTDYPSAHQWYAAYRISQQICDESQISKHRHHRLKPVPKNLPHRLLLSQIAALELTPCEQIQIHCTIVREQIDIGNYEAACRILRPWWSFGNWPKLQGVNQRTCADLLFTAGELASWLASTTQLPRGQKHAEELLNGSIALFEQLGIPPRAAEGRIELALCYYREGLFDIGRSTLIRVVNELSDENGDLRSLALIRLAALERHSGRLKDALLRLNQAKALVELSGPWATARCYLELASTYKDLAISEGVTRYFEYAKHFYLKALYEFEAVGHHRYVAVVENNIGLLLLLLGSCQECESHLLRSRKLFDTFVDSIRGAQVNETLARLYLETGRYSRAHEVIDAAIRILELSDGEVLLAEALTTKGVVAVRLRSYSEAKKSFEAAHKIAERCGDGEGAGRALLMMFEEMGNRLEKTEQTQLLEEVTRLLGTTQQTALQARLENATKTASLHKA